MKNLKLALHANDVVRLYRNGNSAASIARRFSVTTSTVTKLLKENGLMINVKRGERSPCSIADANKAVYMFKSGIRPTEILDCIKRSKSWLYNVLKESDCEFRGLDGWKPTQEHIYKGMKSKEGSTPTNESEKYVLQALVSAGYDVITQAFISNCNVDFAIHSSSIAIEINCRGTFPDYVKRGAFASRIKKFANFGWHTYVLIAKDSVELRRYGIDDMLAWIEFTNRQKAVRRQYRMVRCPSDLLSCGCSDSDNLTSILGPENILQIANR